MANPAAAAVAREFISLGRRVTVKQAGDENGAHFDPMQAIIYWEDLPFNPETANLLSIPQATNIYPSWIVLAHEIGHVIQFGTSLMEPETWMRRYMNFQEFVEMDNIIRHETPIVKSLNLIPRVAYTYNGGNNVRAVKRAKADLRRLGKK